MIDQVQAKPTEETTSDALTIHLGDLLPAKTLAGLRAEAQARHIPLNDLVREVLYYYVADQTEDGLLDTPDEIIEAQFKEAWDTSCAATCRTVIFMTTLPNLKLN